MTVKPLACGAVLALGAVLAPVLHAADGAAPPKAAVADRIAAMQARIDALQRELDALRREAAGDAAAPASADDTAATAPAAVAGAAAPAVDAKPPPAPPAPAAETKPEGIKLGGAVRLQYSVEGYDRDNRRRRGDMDFDIFRLDLDGSIGNVELSAQYRWFQYMSAIHHAWFGYRFTPADVGRLGIVRVPFGNQPFDSHSYFFSSNYYLGLEDAYQTGALVVHDDAPWNLQLAFLKNDALGGVDGYVSDRSASYTYDIVGWRSPDEGLGEDPRNPAGVANTAAARVAYTFRPGGESTIEVGASALRGNLEGPTAGLGHYDAEAVHADAHAGRWNVQVQAARYAYHVAGGAARMAVGAYGFYDSIAARARSWTGNVAYTLPVSLGPVTELTFYNDYSRVNHKSGGLPPTWMNITGMSLSAGGLFTYFDFVTARNQPFIGGSMAGRGKVEHRFNINLGYYF